MLLPSRCLNGNKPTYFEYWKFAKMKWIKLALVSVVVFGLLLWAITLMFPSNTVISRAVNVSGNAQTMATLVQSGAVPVRPILAANDTTLVVQMASKPFYKNNLFNTMVQAAVPEADTVFFSIKRQNHTMAEGGIAFYQLSTDSATTQLFYVFQTPWYQPLEKLKMMMADKAMGASVDRSLQVLKAQLAQ
jgi:hypothetical protein